MENRVMRNTLLALLGSSLLLSQITVRAEDVLADATQNFGPAHPAGTDSTTTNQPAAPAPAPAIAQPKAAPQPAPTPAAKQPAPVVTAAPANPAA
jgi:hypothetical protein